MNNEDLIILRKDDVDKPIEYKHDLLKINFPENSKNKNDEYHMKLRTLNKVMDNLTTSRDLFIEISGRMRIEGQNIAFSPIIKAMFCHAVVLYGACFLRGGKNKRSPLLYQELQDKELKTHKIIMDYRNKLFGHLDENHDVRNEHLFCQFDEYEDKLIPTFVIRSGDRMALAGQAVNGEWVKHITLIIEELSQETSILRNEYEKFIKTHKFVKNSTR